MNDSSVRSLSIVVSAPSGAGKTTLCERLLRDYQNIVYSVSCTTRVRRKSEKEGRDYYFITDETFEEHVKNNAFIEYANVHGYFYGTLKSTINKLLKKEKSILMDIDIKGASQIRAVVDKLPEGSPMKEGFVDIFIEPPSLDVLRERLVRRGEDSLYDIDRRIKNAKHEMNYKDVYRHCLVNRNIDETYDALRDIVVTKMFKPC